MIFEMYFANKTSVKDLPSSNLADAAEEHVIHVLEVGHVTVGALLIVVVVPAIHEILNVNIRIFLIIFRVSSSSTFISWNDWIWRRRAGARNEGTWEITLFVSYHNFSYGLMPCWLTNTFKMIFLQIPSHDLSSWNVVLLGLLWNKANPSLMRLLWRPWIPHFGKLWMTFWRRI